ncbi:hypothetical protein N0V93_006023 [Gnomoniopsis smithogilvyi]|uniref:Uncharacterized protein n=1 Tax=Gnomoniopsis smithogilvyi TaxID=1191159 RepID=A0A9W9CV76_9PEZI|nr:hypothetical protein N0V93_006023 [Gnomoniopsis smithogilvyi]
MDLPEAYRRPRKQEIDSLPITHSWLFKGIKASIGSLQLSEIEHTQRDISSRRRIEVLAEYTWIQITKGQRMANVLFPAVYVPGQPRVWQGITTPSDPLNPQSETPVLTDEHHQRQPSFAYEPTFKVLHTLQELATPASPASINFRHVDIVSDAATLATLFDFLADPDPAKRAPFRLELSTIRQTLFLATAIHRGRGHTEKGNNGSIPAWVASALTTLGTGGHTNGPLFLSGNHFRVVRYRLGTLVLVVRARIDFTLENRAPLSRNEDPPFRECRYEQYHATDNKGKEHVHGFKTLVKNAEGRGTRPGAAGITSVRFAGWDCAATLAGKMPLLWFGRTPFVLDGVVSREFKVMETKLYCARESYRVWEKQHQTSLKLMAGTLEQLHGVTRAAGGNCIVIGDPGQRCLRLQRPTLKRFPVPESLALAVWGLDEDPAKTVYASNTESEADSELSQLSGTPSGFSDWKLEREKIPELPSAPSHRNCVASRRVVEDWLNGDESGQEPSTDDEEGCGEVPISQKDVFACARNPVVQYMLPNGPRRQLPTGSFRGYVLDGAADDNEDGEISETTEGFEYVPTDDQGDSDQEMTDHTVKQADGIETSEEDAMDWESRSATVSRIGVSSSPTLQNVPLDDQIEDDDIVFMVDNQPTIAIEVDDLRLQSTSPASSRSGSLELQSHLN